MILFTTMMLREMAKVQSPFSISDERTMLLGCAQYCQLLVASARKNLEADLTKF
jgi:hypothetical protein